MQRKSALRDDVSAISPLQRSEPRVDATPQQLAPQTTGLAQRATGSLQKPTAKSAPSRASRAALREQVKRASGFAKKPRSEPKYGPVSGVSQAWLLNDPPRSQPVDSNNRPKTRAEVVAELARARKDGSLPAFGNPNQGPGGTPGQSIYAHP
jgi:hypothetical protein